MITSLEKVIEEAAVLIADLFRDLLDSHVGRGQEYCCLIHAVLLDIFPEALVQIFFQKQIIIIPVIVEVAFQILNSDIG